jgi:quaternary ammonium compound-resistance protein SugE
MWLLVAGLLEVVWSYFMKRSDGFSKFWPTLVTLVTMTASFGLLSFAMKTLPLGTAYVIWTGIGAIGALAVGVAWFGEPLSLSRVSAALLIVSGLLLMKQS